MTITHDALALSIQGPPLPPSVQGPPMFPALLLVTSGGQDQRPVQTCSLRGSLVLTSGGWLLKHVHGW